MVDWPFTLVRVFAFYPFYAFGVLFRPQIDMLDRLATRFWAVRAVPALLLLAGYGVRFLQMMQYEGQLGESAKIFNDAAYGEGYALPGPRPFPAGGYRHQCGTGGRRGRLPDPGPAGPADLAQSICSTSRF